MLFDAEVSLAEELSLEEEVLSFDDDDEDVPSMDEEVLSLERDRPFDDEGDPLEG